ncbi:MAG: hypothetical protein JKY37_17295 [Nannocystaceae bacterium]|nr:hypothetical protein [Nannocystaceae bacterium]
MRAFIETYGIQYTVLIPGEPDQATELLPQAVNLDCSRRRSFSAGMVA